MDKQTIIFDSYEDKKHSVCYKTSEKDAAIKSVYVMRHALGGSIPTRLALTIEA
jgi:hypothetical protein